jgi:hypothetical protein
MFFLGHDESAVDENKQMIDIVASVNFLNEKKEPNVHYGSGSKYLQSLPARTVRFGPCIYRTVLVAPEYI